VTSKQTDKENMSTSLYKTAIELGAELAPAYEIDGIMQPATYTGTLAHLQSIVDAAIAVEREACAVEAERMMMYPRGREESAAHENVWAAAKAIRARS